MNLFDQHGKACDVCDERFDARTYDRLNGVPSVCPCCRAEHATEPVTPEEIAGVLDDFERRLCNLENNINKC